MSDLESSTHNVTEINYSFILPSRGRPQLLQRSLRSIYENAHYPDKAEALVRIDEDDQLSLDFVKTNSIFYDYNIRVFVGPRLGYSYLWVIHKNLYTLTKGAFIIPYGDDCSMRWPNWDDGWLPYKDSIAVLGQKYIHGFTRKAYEKYSFLRECGEDPRSVAIDADLYAIACREGIFICEKNFWRIQSQHLNDQTEKEGAGGGWRLNDLSLLQVPDKELIFGSK